MTPPWTSSVLVVLLSAFSVRDQCREKPDRCKSLPWPEYKTPKRVNGSDARFEVYRLASGIFVIYEAHLSEKEMSGVKSFHHNSEAVLNRTPDGVTYATQY